MILILQQTLRKIFLQRNDNYCFILFYLLYFILFYSVYFVLFYFLFIDNDNANNMKNARLDVQIHSVEKVRLYSFFFIHSKLN